MTTEVRRRIEELMKSYGRASARAKSTAEDGEEAQRTLEEGGRCSAPARPEIHLVVRREESVEPGKRRCEWVRRDDQGCGRAAEEKSRYCERHRRWARSYAWRHHGLDFPEERAAIQEMLAKTVDLVLRLEVKPQAAEVIVKACKMLMRMRE